MPPNVPAWPVLGALVIGFIVRLLKSANVPAPFDRIPPKARPVVAVALGGLQGALQAALTSTPWQTTLVNGLVAGLLAVFGHDVLIEWLRAGKEPLEKALPVPVGDPSLTGLRDALAAEAGAAAADANARPTPREVPSKPSRPATELLLAIAEDRKKERAREAEETTVTKPVTKPVEIPVDLGGVK